MDFNPSNDAGLGPLNFRYFRLHFSISAGKQQYYNVFPFRTKRDLVSYYYNVFILRKHANQNRFDPHNVDSYNDEWQISEHEAGTVEEDEDSGVESPTNEDAPTYQEDHAKDCEDDIEGEYERDDFKNGAQVVSTVATDEDEGDVDDISVQHVKNSFDDCWQYRLTSFE